MQRNRFMSTEETDESSQIKPSQSITIPVENTPGNIHISMSETDESFNVSPHPPIMQPDDCSIKNVITTYISRSNTLKAKEMVMIVSAISGFGGLPMFPTDELSNMMGKILASDCVILFYTSKINADDLKCEICSLYGHYCDNTNCHNNLEFELRFSVAHKKKVIVFIDNESEHNEFLNLLSAFQPEIKVVHYSDLSEDLIVSPLVEAQRTLFSNGVGFFKRQDYCLSVLNKCVQRASVPQKTIGEYTNTSGEMNAVGNSEIHILTNEWMNYDFTTMSSLTIAINTKKGVKYCYYAPKKYEHIIDTFKEVLKDYYIKSFKAREKVVAWIRMSKCERYYLDDFLSNVANKSIKDVLSSLLVSCDSYSSERINRLLNLCKEGDSFISLKVDHNKLNEWIHGKIINNDKTLLRFLRNIGIMLNALKSEEELCEKTNVDDFCKKLRLLYNMYLLLQWQTGRDEENQHDFTNEEINELISYFKYKDNNAHNSQNNLIISDSFEEWLCPTDGQNVIGALLDDDNNVDNYLQNILFLPIDESTSFTLAYSFTLFLGYSPNGATYNESAAWYTTISDNESSDLDRIDNGLFMVDVGPKDELFAEIKEIFRRIINSNETIRNKLEKSNSIILRMQE